MITSIVEIKDFNMENNPGKDIYFSEHSYIQTFDKTNTVYMLLSGEVFKEKKYLTKFYERL